MQTGPMYPLPQASEGEGNQARYPSILEDWAPVADKVPSAYPYRIQCDKRNLLAGAKLGPKEFSGFKTAADAMAWFKSVRRADPFHFPCFYEVIMKVTLWAGTNHVYTAFYYSARL